MGPIATATAELLGWLARAGVPARLAAPAGVEPPAEVGAAPEPYLCVWPLSLLPEQPTRGGATLEPLRLRVRYVLTATAGADDLARLLDRVLTAAAADPEFPLVIAPIADATWESLRALPRAALLADMPVRIDRPAPTVPRVRSALRLQDVALAPLTGQVVGPHGVALPGIRIEVAGTGVHTFTDARGGFWFAGLPADLPARLLLSGKGLHLSTEVAVIGPEPVVIHCETEEV